MKENIYSLYCKWNCAHIEYSVDGRPSFCSHRLRRHDGTSTAAAASDAAIARYHRSRQPTRPQCQPLQPGDGHQRRGLEQQSISHVIRKSKFCFNRMTLTSFCLYYSSPSCWRYTMLAVQRRQLTYAC